MGYGIVSLNIVPVRKEMDAKSEMTNQLFFGEIITIIEVKNKWSFISSDLDNYKGWIRNIQYQSIQKNDYNTLTKTNYEFALNEVVLENSNGEIIVPTGSLISSAKFLNYSYTTNNLSKSLNETIMSFLNSPYLWGGKSKFGTDCSGLVQSIFKTIGIILPRDACDQYKVGFHVLDNFKLGDLAFFGKKPNNISHVGILIDKNKIVHAYGKVRMDKLKSDGIYNNEEKRITHLLQEIKRII